MLAQTPTPKKDKNASSRTKSKSQAKAGSASSAPAQKARKKSAAAASDAAARSADSAAAVVDDGDEEEEDEDRSRAAAASSSQSRKKKSRTPGRGRPLGTPNRPKYDSGILVTSDGPTNCTLCPAGFGTSSALVAHALEAHQMHMCMACGKMYNKRASLWAHQLEITVCWHCRGSSSDHQVRRETSSFSYLSHAFIVLFHLHLTSNILATLHLFRPMLSTLNTALSPLRATNSRALSALTSFRTTKDLCTLIMNIVHCVYLP